MHMCVCAHVCACVRVGKDARVRALLVWVGMYRMQGCYTGLR